MRDDRLYLIHVLESGERLQQYTSAGKEQFLQSTIAQDAEIRNYQVIGEYGAKSPPELFSGVNTRLH